MARCTIKDDLYHGPMQTLGRVVLACIVGCEVWDLPVGAGAVAVVFVRGREVVGGVCNGQALPLRRWLYGLDK